MGVEKKWQSEAVEAAHGIDGAAGGDRALDLWAVINICYTEGERH